MHLRHLALTINDGDPGCFTWLLMESSGDAVVFDLELAASEHPFPSYSEALRRGYEALLAMADSRKDGPRASGEDENLDPVTEGEEVGEQHCSRSMDHLKPHIVWTSSFEFEVVPPLSPPAMLRFMATPEYADAMRIWRDRNYSAGRTGMEVVLRPAGALVDDLRNGGPVDPAKSRHFH